MQTCIFSSDRVQHQTGNVKSITLVCYNKNACKICMENDILKTWRCHYCINMGNCAERRCAKVVSMKKGLLIIWEEIELGKA